MLFLDFHGSIYLPFTSLLSVSHVSGLFTPSSAFSSLAAACSPSNHPIRQLRGSLGIPGSALQAVSYSILLCPLPLYFSICLLPLSRMLVVRVLAECIRRWREEMESLFLSRKHKDQQATSTLERELLSISQWFSDLPITPTTVCFERFITMVVI